VVFGYLALRRKTKTTPCPLITPPSISCLRYQAHQDLPFQPLIISIPFLSQQVSNLPNLFLQIWSITSYYSLESNIEKNLQGGGSKKPDHTHQLCIFGVSLSLSLSLSLYFSLDSMRLCGVNDGPLWSVSRILLLIKASDHEHKLYHFKIVLPFWMGLIKSSLSN
jgi:hypothetical protein